MPPLVKVYVIVSVVNVLIILKPSPAVDQVGYRARQTEVQGVARHLLSSIRFYHIACKSLVHGFAWIGADADVL